MYILDYCDLYIIFFFKLQPINGGLYNEQRGSSKIANYIQRKTITSKLTLKTTWFY